LHRPVFTLSVLPWSGDAPPIGDTAAISLGDHAEACARSKVESGECVFAGEVIAPI
jgi:hypothetical protein